MKKILLVFCAVALFVSCADKPFVIIQLADTQLGFDAAIKGQAEGAIYVNDLSHELKYLSASVEGICEINPDMVVFTGDQVNLAQDTEQWTMFEESISRIPSGVDVRHLPGNHDVLISEGSVDNTPFTDRYGVDRFVYQDKKVCVVGINSNLIKYNDPSEDEQFEWIKSVLESADKGAVKLVFCHHPFFLTDIEEEDSYFPIQRDKRKRYFDMFAQNGVSVVYAGHRHEGFEGEYKGVAMKTTASVGYRLGETPNSYRCIVIDDGQVLTDSLCVVE